MCCYVTDAHLVKELFSCRIRLDGKLQLCIHGGHTDVDLEIQLEVYFVCRIIQANILH